VQEPWLGFRSGDGPLSVRARPSRLKHDCGRRTTSTGGKCLANVHAKSCLIPEPLRALRPETKGQAGACPDRTRAIPCTLPAVTSAAADSNGDSNSTSQRQASAVGGTQRHMHICLATWDMSGLKSGRSEPSVVFRWLQPTRWTTADMCRQIWNVGAAHDRPQTALGDLPASTDRKLSGSEDPAYTGGQPGILAGTGGQTGRPRIARGFKRSRVDTVDRPGKFGGPCLPNTVMLPAPLAGCSSFPRILSAEHIRRRSGAARCCTRRPIPW